MKEVNIIKMILSDCLFYKDILFCLANTKQGVYSGQEGPPLRIHNCWSGLIETGGFTNDQRANTFHWNAEIENEKTPKM